MNESHEEEDQVMVEIELGRIVLRDHSSIPQYIYLREKNGERSFPIVIGFPEASEIQRVITRTATERPLTHELLHNALNTLGAHLARVDIVDIRQNTYFAQLFLENEAGEAIATLDARPSDSVALALRAGCPIRVAESVLEQVRTDEANDPLPNPEGPPKEPPSSEDEPPQTPPQMPPEF